jgi:hypothetical protein
MGDTSRSRTEEALTVLTKDTENPEVKQPNVKKFKNRTNGPVEMDFGKGKEVIVLPYTEVVLTREQQSHSAFKRVEKHFQEVK